MHPQVPARVTLRALVDEVLVDVRDTCKPATVQYWEEKFRRVVLPEFGADTPVAAITEARVRDWLARTAERTSQATAAHYWAAISRLMQHALRTGYIDRSPLLRVRRPKRGPRRTEFLTADEVWAVVAAIRAAPKIRTAREFHACLVEFLFLTGLRLAEVCRIRQRDFDERAGTLFVDDGKSEPRHVLLGPTARRALATMCKHMPLNSGRVRAALEDWAHRLGLKGRLRAHALRHSHATALVSAGIPMAQVGRMLGHKSLEMSYRYTHASPAMRQAVEALDPLASTNGDVHPSHGGGGCTTLPRGARFLTENVSHLSSRGRPMSTATVDLDDIEDVETFARELPARLKAARLAAGFKTLRAAAEATGGRISRSRLNHWELGNWQPGVHAALVLARLYGVSTDYLLGLSDS